MNLLLNILFRFMDFLKGDSKQENAFKDIYAKGQDLADKNLYQIMLDKVTKTIGKRKTEVALRGRKDGLKGIPAIDYEGEFPILLKFKNALIGDFKLTLAELRSKLSGLTEEIKGSMLEYNIAPNVDINAKNDNYKSTAKDEMNQKFEDIDEQNRIKKEHKMAQANQLQHEADEIQFTRLKKAEEKELPKTNNPIKESKFTRPFIYTFFFLELFMVMPCYYYLGMPLLHTFFTAFCTVLAYGVSAHQGGRFLKLRKEDSSYRMGSFMFIALGVACAILMGWSRHSYLILFLNIGNIPTLLLSVTVSLMLFFIGFYVSYEHTLPHPEARKTHNNLLKEEQEKRAKALKIREECANDDNACIEAKQKIKEEAKARIEQYANTFQQGQKVVSDLSKRRSQLIEFTHTVKDIYAEAIKECFFSYASENHSMRGNPEMPKALDGKALKKLMESSDAILKNLVFEFIESIK